jgi:ribosome-interacting GTPase 1
MPANLPPQYYELEREFKAEKDIHEKLRLAEELLRMMPKHKGTDKLQADMKAKISQLKKQVETGGEAKHGVSHVKTFDHIEREGAGQIILIGPPNSGKSSILESLTHAKPLVADYPYTTREPMTGMMDFETVHLQLVDTPPISEELFENYLTNLIRLADTVVLVADLSSKRMLDDLNFIVTLLEDKRIVLRPMATLNHDDPRLVYKRTIICAHKAFEDEATGQFRQLQERFPGFRIVKTSVLEDNSLVDFKKAVFESLGVMRVYTKRVGDEVEYKDPIILPLGGTVIQAANTLHKEFGAKLKFAKVWGEGKFDGQRVHNEFVLSDKDVVEFHI